MHLPNLSPLVLACALALVATAPSVLADWIPTNVGTGADAEVRDHQPSTNFGASTELATRHLAPDTNIGNRDLNVLPPTSPNFIPLRLFTWAR